MDALFKRFNPRNIADFIECQARDVCRSKSEDGSAKSVQCLFEEYINGKLEQIEFTIDIDYTLPRYEPNYLDGMLEGWHETTDLEFTITITSGMYIDDDGYGHALTEEQLDEVKRFSLIVS